MESWWVLKGGKLPPRLLNIGQQIKVAHSMKQCRFIIYIISIEWYH